MAAASLQLDVESIRALIAVVDHGGMTRAAEHLHLTQSAVSWKVKRLEEKVGRPLLVREGHTVRPNRDGQALIDDGREMVELHDRAVLRLQRAELTGLVRLGANEDLDITRLVAILGSFRRMHPATSVQFFVGETEDLAAMVDDGRLDLALIQVTGPDVRPADTVLWTEQLHWATTTREQHDTRPVPLVTYGQRCFYQAIAQPILDGAGVDYTIAFSGSSTPTVQAAVESGLGVAVLSDRGLTPAMEPWTAGVDLDPLPEVHQIVRTVPGEDPEVACALTEVIAREL